MNVEHNLATLPSSIAAIGDAPAAVCVIAALVACPLVLWVIGVAGPALSRRCQVAWILRGDWWRHFEREFRDYVTGSRPAGRSGEVRLRADDLRRGTRGNHR